MGNKVRIELTPSQIEFLSSQPEQGMGYQIVDIILYDERMLPEKIVYNSSILELEMDEAITPSQIKELRLHK